MRAWRHRRLPPRGGPRRCPRRRVPRWRRQCRPRGPSCRQGPPVWPAKPPAASAGPTRWTTPRGTHRLDRPSRAGRALSS
eukprot:scaffold4312_cov101-Isochrysis_galbana.AAC.6